MNHDLYPFGNSKASVILAEALKTNKKLSKKVSRHLIRFNQGLHELEKVDDIKIRAGLATCWMNQHFNHNLVISPSILNGVTIDSLLKNVVRYRWRKWTREFCDLRGQ